MTVSLCHHSHIVLPPHGSIFNPGPCTNCGITWDQVQDEIRRQEEALILGTAHDGTCPDCSQQRRLFRFQPPARPWHDFDYEPPVTFLCLRCWNNAADAEDQAADALINSI
jgi:hypothetical protein